MAYGITSAGFVPKPLADIKTDLEGGFRAVFGAAITVIAQSVFGQIIGIMSERLADVWQLGLATYSASFRESATGIQLDNIGALTGTARLQATYTKVNLVLTGVNGTVIPVGRVVSIPSTGVKFTNDVAGTISGGTLTLEFRASETGPKTAYANTVTSIDTPVSGWNTVNNPADHTLLGSDIESDASYRIRQVQELRGQGQGTVAAIRAKIFTVSTVTDAFIFENTSDATNGDGLPPHSFESVVQGGTDAAVAKAISDVKPAGIATHGTTTQATTDGNGFAVNIKFSRPTTLNVRVDMAITVDAALFPTNGTDLIKQAVANYGDVNYHVGSEVRSSAFVPYIFSACPGVLECTLPLISSIAFPGAPPTPTSSATIVVSNRERPDLDTSRMNVTVTSVNPS